MITLDLILSPSKDEARTSCFLNSLLGPVPLCWSVLIRALMAVSLLGDSPMLFPCGGNLPPLRRRRLAGWKRGAA